MDILNNTSYCGIYCAKCYLLKDNPIPQAQALLKKFKDMKFEIWGPELAKQNQELSAFEYVEQCYQVLDTWKHMSCKNMCRSGGGSSNCEIRNCCQSRKFDGCWQCDSYTDCARIKSLDAINGKMIEKNINKIKEIGLDAFCRELEHTQGCLFYEATS